MSITRSSTQIYLFYLLKVKPSTFLIIDLDDFFFFLFLFFFLNKQNKSLLIDLSHCF
jgi:hypothetical protein